MQKTLYYKKIIGDRETATNNWTKTTKRDDASSDVKNNCEHTRPGCLLAGAQKLG